MLMARVPSFAFGMQLSILELCFLTINRSEPSINDRGIETQKMNNNYRQQHDKTMSKRKLFAAALLFGCALSTANNASAQQLTPPPTPTDITPPVGNSAFLVGHAVGTQGYVCLPTVPGASTASWTVNAARPEATLFLSPGGQNFQIITHFLSPNENPIDPTQPVPFGNATWQSSFDSSRVWAAVLKKENVITAGTDPASCPNTGSIACLLLTTVGAKEGPTGGTLLSKTSFIQRLNTNGGSAPNDGCFTSADVGKQALVPYTADYFFYRKDK